MDKRLFYSPSSAPAIRYALGELQRQGHSVIHHISPEITHVLLEVPSFTPEGLLRQGQQPEELFTRLPEKARIFGGGTPPFPVDGYLDLLNDPVYAAENARITAQCALSILGKESPLAYRDMELLILGWGRIGKCLTRDLTALGADITVFARKETDRAMLSALGIDALSPDALNGCSRRFSCILNTVPAPLPIPDADLILDLASLPGLGRPDAIAARGLPGRYAPASSGRLIARRVLAHCKEERL